MIIKTYIKCIATHIANRSPSISYCVMQNNMNRYIAVDKNRKKTDVTDMNVIWPTWMLYD